MTQYTAGITSCFDESFQEGSILPDFLIHYGEFFTMAEKVLYEEVIDFLDAVSAANDNGRKIIRPDITMLRLQTPQTLLLDWPLNVQY